MPDKQIVIDIEHGIVNVFASDPDLSVILVDWDQSVDPRSRNMIEITRGRHKQSALVVAVPTQPLYELAGSNTEQAIDAACEQGAIQEPELVCPS